MPILLSDAVAELPDWTLRPFKAKAGQMLVAGILGKHGHWPAVQLLPADCMGAVTVPFPPSVYRGTGNEPRKGIMFMVPESVLLAIAAIEEWARKQIPDEVWHSAIKQSENYPATLKAKINVTGPNACRILDTKQRPIAWPDNWSRLAVMPIIEFRGVYSQKTGSGLILEVSHLMIQEAEGDPTLFV
jgi:hypothetical protein